MTTGATRTLRAQYLVGCDGPSGIVREALGIGIEGLGAIAHSVNLFFRSAELAAFHDKGWARFYRVIDETGCWAELIPIDGKELWRLTVFDEPLSAADPDFLLRKLAGGAVRLRDAQRVALGAARLRRAAATARAASSSPATPRMNARRPAASACIPVSRRPSISAGSSPP